MEGTFMNLLILALAVEIATNAIKNYLKPVQSKGYTTLAAAILGVALCWAGNVGVFAANGVEFASTYPIIDYIATGLIVSRAAGILNGLSKKLS